MTPPTCQSKAAQCNDKWYRLYCFEEQIHALSFQLMFGGELLDRRANVNSSMIFVGRFLSTVPINEPTDCRVGAASPRKTVTAMTQARVRSAVDTPCLMFVLVTPRHRQRRDIAVYYSMKTM
jgi:hypothetical protein